MKPTIDVFSVRELRTRTGDLMRDAEEGRLAVITKRGRPAALSVPFDESLMRLGVQKTLAVRFFKDGILSMGQARRLSGMDAWDFTDLLASEGVDAVDYDPAELDRELGGLEAK